MDDAFAPPNGASGGDDPVSAAARRTLNRDGLAAIALGVFQFCCNPFWIVTVAAAGAGINAIRQPRWLAISMEDDYPADAGRLCSVLGYTTIGLVILRVLVGLMLPLIRLSEAVLAG